ncbi:MAG: Flp pilus assembly protein CpaB [Anaerolineae bacterium UTCFX2]|jgi:pilus assembly protein CpaB|nr:Flp pilus assembly protein CpaB [Anaerolineae bacterium]MCZ7553237.1 Flp pilus assembly protein CpaB [Anaerolineales bacterium]OQY93698.1 MAG: Flp pilus assembly protein CpaB [Anaerolineae bacterium UTCFX2]
MRRGRLLILLALVILLGLVAVLVVYRFFLAKPQEAVQPTQPPPVEILMISQNISKGTELNSEMLASIPWQQSALAPGMYRAGQINEAIGRVVKFDVSAGTPLLTSMLLSEGETISQAGSPWSLSIPKGMVAVSIPVSRLSSVSYAPRPGDHVNVIASFLFVDVDTDFQSILPSSSGTVIAAGPPDPVTGTRNPLTVEIAGGVYGRTIIDPVLGQAVFLLPSEAQRPRMVSHMLLQDVVVLNVGDFPLTDAAAQAQAEPTPAPAEGQAPPPPPVPNVITLIVRPQDAVTLNFMLLTQMRPEAATQLSLALRAGDDNSRENTLPVTLGFLLEQYQIPVPAKLPYSLNPRIDNLTPLPLPAAQPTQ